MFTVGESYNRRRDIHATYGGQRQGGISTPSECEYIFLFTGEAGTNYGYKDEFRPDGVFLYTGEGQIGDMPMLRGNKAIANHIAKRKTLLLFESKSHGMVNFVGSAQYLGHHYEERTDSEGNTRKAIIFELAIDSAPEVPENSMQVSEPISKKLVNSLWRVPIKELRKAALAKPSRAASSQERRENVYYRSQAIRIYVLRRSSGKCEYCEAGAPFLTTRGQPYLEPHHVKRLADGGPDHPSFVIALCPNCHRRAHYSADSSAFNEQCKKLLTTIEKD